MADEKMLGEVPVGSIVRIDDKCYEVIDAEAGVGVTELAPVTRIGGEWVRGLTSIACAKARSIYPDETLVTVVT